jgi:hypothetical protein
MPNVGHAARIREGNGPECRRKFALRGVVLAQKRAGKNDTGRTLLLGNQARDLSYVPRDHLPIRERLTTF